MHRADTEALAIAHPGVRTPAVKVPAMIFLVQDEERNFGHGGKVHKPSKGKTKYVSVLVSLFAHVRMQVTTQYVLFSFD